MPSLSQIGGGETAMYIVLFAVAVTSLFGVYTGLMTGTVSNVLGGLVLFVLATWFIYSMNKEEGGLE